MIDASPRRLRVFKLVVDLGGFSAAAGELGIAQPSVGAHVDGLEQQVGEALLLRRRGARPQLTEAGRIVYELAAEVLRLNEDAARRLKGVSASKSPELLIAAHRDLALSYLPPRLSRFTAAHPRARIVTRIGTIEDVLGLLESGAVQLGLLLSGGPLVGVESEVIGKEPLLLIVAPSHPLARKRRISAIQLLKASFVTGLKNSRYVAIVDLALASIGLRHYDVAIELQEFGAVKEVARSGQSIACLPRCTVEDEVRSGALVALDLEHGLPDLQVRCAHVHPPGPLARRLIAALREN